jgi:hypothetical protein
MYFALQGIGKNEYAGTMNKIMVELLKVEESSVSSLMAQFRDDVTKFELDNIMKALDTMKFCSVYENTGRIIVNKEFGK